jgi:hypothetical protein
MHATRLRVTIPQNRSVRIDLPEGTPVGSADIIVLFDDDCIDQGGAAAAGPPSKNFFGRQRRSRSGSLPDSVELVREDRGR